MESDLHKWKKINCLYSICLKSPYRWTSVLRKLQLDFRKALGTITIQKLFTSYERTENTQQVINKKIFP
jgi:hypothetical protein